MTYVEYSVSHGEGTLIEHGVVIETGPSRPADGERSIEYTAVRIQNYEIDVARYNEFIAMHGSERAV
jgi:acetyltransferase-like isoleucine patch superfamily enzyme